MDKYNFTQIIVTLCVTILLLLVPVAGLTFFEDYYFSAFTRFGVYHNFANQFIEIELQNNFREILDFISFPFNTTLTPGFFTVRDVMHMQDVRGLFIVIYGTVFAVLTVLIATLLVNGKSKGNWINIKLLNSLALAFLASSLLFLTNWQKAFFALHQVLFPHNTYWQLSYSNSNLIKYLPAEIFQELAVIYVSTVFLGLIAINIYYHKTHGKRRT